MLSRLSTWVVPAIVGAFMAVSPANANTVVGSFNVGSLGLHTGSLAVNHGTAASDTDEININITSTAILSPGASLYITLDPSLFSSISYAWSGGGSGSLTGIGTSVLIPLPLPTLPGLYTLSFIWASANPGVLSTSYQYSLDFDARGGAGDVPLPPAVILFGSALVGLMMLKRRRSRRAAEFAAA